MLSRRLFSMGLSVLSLSTPLYASSSTVAQIEDSRKRINAETVLGDPNSKVLVEEFISATCPHCKKFHEEIFPKIKKLYIDTNRIAWQIHMFPLDRDSLMATKIIECVPTENFHVMVDAFLEGQKIWAGKGDQAVKDFAIQIGLSEEQVEECLLDKQLESLIIRGILSAQKLYGINSTPSFVLNGELQKGGGSMTNLKLVIERALRES